MTTRLVVPVQYGFHFGNVQLPLLTLGMLPLPLAFGDHTGKWCHTHKWIWIWEGKNQSDLVEFTYRDGELDYEEDSGDLRGKPCEPLGDNGERERTYAWNKSRRSGTSLEHTGPGLNSQGT